MSTQLLKKALIGNIIFSTFSAIISILLSEIWSPLKQMANGDGIGFGIQLLAFAGFILFVILKQKFTAPYIYAIIILDILFILGTVVRFIIDNSFTPEGYILTGFSSIVVLAFALLQWHGYRLLMEKI